MLLTLKCPNPACNEQNIPNKKAMIELDEKGHGYCNKCGRDFLVDQVKEKP